MPVRHIVLGLGTFAAIGSYAAAGRRAALLITALWSAGTAYLFMAPTYSFRVSERSDLIALTLYGAFGLVFARIAQKTRMQGADSGTPRKPAAAEADLAGVFAELMSSSQMGDGWRRSGISAHTFHLGDFRCPHADGARVLSDVLSAISGEPDVHHVSLHVARRPVESLLFIDVYRAGMTQPKTITVGQSTGQPSYLAFAAWPQGWKACRFEYPWGSIYRVSLDRNACGQQAPIIAS